MNQIILFSLFYPQLKDAGLRELYEETGLRITGEMCNHVPIIAAWEVCTNVCK